MRCATTTPTWRNRFRRLRQAIENLRKNMLAGDTNALAEHADKLAEFQQALFNDVRETFQSLQNQDVSAPLRWTICPPALRDQFVGRDRQISRCRFFPNTTCGSARTRRTFVTDLRTVDPNATGTPVQFYEYETLDERQLHSGGVVFAGRDCHYGASSISAAWGR